MATTVRDIATRALRRIGVLAAGQVPNAGQSQGALDRLNDWLDALKAERLSAYTVARATATLTASQTSFSVGTGGNINIARPAYIEDVNYVDNSVSPALEVDIGPLLTEQQYQAIPQKTQTSARPSLAYYNPTYPLGTLIPWPISTGASLLWAVYYAAVVDEYATFNDAVALPPGYRLMMISNLAVQLLGDYGRQPDQLLVDQAAEAKAVVKRANERLRLMQFPAESLIGTGGGRFDIRTGTSW